ncbi:MAG: DUF3536 domain-containing protein [Acidobacteriota bacterium]
MNRYICIHGHFYQPPRENPWLEEIEIQDSAYPFHDWNERIAAECYGPNSASRILDAQKKIINIVNNYTRISFNFGPTLLSWLEKQEPEIYQAIIEADKGSQKNFSGHGPALAQPYNHIIMPLASIKDKRTQILWGIRDFELRFERKPEGMWLPETAVDLETLSILAELGIKFVLLAPHQASRVKKKGHHEWIDVQGGKIDPRKPYFCLLPSGRAINIFFYDGSISHGVAFGDLLKSGDFLVEKLLNTFSNESKTPQLINIATDGETYGHHNRFGDMALGYCLHHIESNNLANITVYGEFLENFPPQEEVEIVERSSWSCSHGVERWKGDCGCSSGGHPSWNQKWRAPLRQAMDWLRDKLYDIYDREAKELLTDPWQARDDYIKVIHNRSETNVFSFLTTHQSRELSSSEKAKALKLLESMRNEMLMFTSCGWFFDDISRIETIQIMQYAARAIQLAGEVSGENLESGYQSILEKAESNLPELGNGAQIYAKFIKPSVLDLMRVGIHYALSSLFEDYPETVRIGSFQAKVEDLIRLDSGRHKLALGKTIIHSEITWEEDKITSAVIHLGDQNLFGGVRQYQNHEAFSLMSEEIKRSFNEGEIPAVINLIEKHFKTNNYSLKDLFKDEKRKVLLQIFDPIREEIESSFRRVFEHHYSLMQTMWETKIPLPKALATPVEYTLNAELKKLMEEESIKLDRLESLIKEFRKWDFKPDKLLLSYVTSKKLNSLMKELSLNPENLKLLKNISSIFQILKGFPLELDLWKSQNICFFLAKNYFPQIKKKAEQGEEKAQDWQKHFQILGNFLGVKTG